MLNSHEDSVTLGVLPQTKNYFTLSDSDPMHASVKVCHELFYTYCVLHVAFYQTRAETADSRSCYFSDNVSSRSLFNYLFTFNSLK